MYWLSFNKKNSVLLVEQRNKRQILIKESHQQRNPEPCQVIAVESRGQPPFTGGHSEAASLLGVGVFPTGASPGRAVPFQHQPPEGYTAPMPAVTLQPKPWPLPILFTRVLSQQGRQDLEAGWCSSLLTDPLGA